jgi:hypothetical protein
VAKADGEVSSVNSQYLLRRRCVTVRVYDLDLRADTLREHRREQTEKQSPNPGFPEPQHQKRGSCFHRWCHCPIALSSLRGDVEKWGAIEVKVEGKGAGKPRRHRSHICLGGHNQDLDVPGRVLIY